MEQIKKSVIDLLNFLSYDEESRFLPQSQSLYYKKIGKASVEKQCDELEKVDFTIEYNMNGYSFEYITFARDKANVSLRVKYDGIAILPKNEFGLQTIKTFIYRAYTLINDGKLNINVLPVLPSSKLIEFLSDNHIEYKKDENIQMEGAVIINIASLPIMDISYESMGDISFPTFTASKLVRIEMELFWLQSLRKYLKSLSSVPLDTPFKPTVEVDNWLKSIGITSYSGYSQKTEAAESDNTNSYKIKTLKTKISSLSNIPTVEAVNKKIASGKPLTPSENILNDAIKWFNEYVADELKPIKSEKIYKTVRQELIYQQEKETDSNIKLKLFQISQIGFYILTTGNWFEDKKSFEDNTLEFDYNDKKFTATFELSEDTVKL